MTKLSDAHRAHLHASGLTDETIELAGFYTIESDREIAALLRWKGPPRDHAWGGGLAIPFHVPSANDPIFVRVRPNTPRPKGGKYEQPKKDSGPHNFAPYFPRRVLEAGTLGDASRELVLTEGEKKGELLAQLGHVAIASTGVDCFHDAAIRDTEDRWTLHPLIREHVALAGRRCVILFDADAADPRKPQLRAAAERLAGMLLEGGAREVRFTHPPAGGPKGIDDLFVASGEAGARVVAELLAAASTIEPAPLEAKPRDKRPIVELDVDRERVVDATIEALANEPRLFRRGTGLARILEPSGLPPDLTYREIEPATIAPVEIETLGEWASTRTRIVTRNREGDLEPAHPPTWLLKAIVARGSWPKLRHLEAMIEAPALTGSGAVLERQGYDVASGLYLAGESAPVPARPSSADVRRALEVLADLVKDFPFRAPEHRSAWLAATLTPLARFAFPGAAPLFLFDASAAGTGKTLLASTSAAIATGRGLPLDSLPVDRGRIDERELEKRIFSWAMSGRRIVCLDNVKGAPLGGAELERAITATTVGGRVLGASRDWSGPFCATWYVTGNNVELGGDMHRRVCHVRLEAPCERPEERTFDRALGPHLRAHRVELTGAALTLLRAYAAAGRPDQRLPEWGGFEAWSELVRGAIVWAGWPDPAATRVELRAGAASRGEVERAFVVGWAQLVETIGRKQGLTVKEALTMLAPGDGREPPSAAAELLAAMEELGGATSEAIGKVLRTVRGRMVTDAAGRPVALDVTGKAQGGVSRWGAMRADSGGDGGDGGDLLIASTHARTRGRAPAPTPAHEARPGDPHHPPDPHPSDDPFADEPDVERLEAEIERRQAELEERKARMRGLATGGHAA